MTNLRKLFHKAVTGLYCLSQLTVFSVPVTTAETLVEAPAMDKPAMGKFVVRETGDDGLPLGEATFLLKSDVGDVKVSQQTDAQTGEAIFSALAPGSYTLTEQKSPAGYHPSDKVWTVKVTEDGETTVTGEGVVEKEEARPTEPTREVEYEDDKTWYLLGPVEDSKVGESYKAWNPVPYERVIDEGTLSKKIDKVNDLEGNRYRIALTVSGKTTNDEEKSIEEGIITDPMGDMVELELGNDGRFDSEDYSLKGSDGSHLENGQALGGPKKDGGVLKKAQVSYDETIRTLRVTGLTLGADETVTLTYNVHLMNQFISHTFYDISGRTTLQPKGDRSETVRDFPIPKIGEFLQYKSSDIRKYPEITLPKERKLGRIEFTKYALETQVNDQGQILETDKKIYLGGGQFELWKLNPKSGQYEKDGNREPAISAETTGKFAFDKISVGTYKIKETVAPEGYKNSNGAFVAEFTYTEAAEFKNVKPESKEIKNVKGGEGRVELTKLSRENGVETILPGATFVIKDGKGNVLDTQVSDGQGKLVFDELPYGVYYVEETKAPTGYEKSNNSLSIYVGPDFDVPKDDRGQDVGDKVHATSGSIKSYDYNNDELIHNEVIPGQSGYLRIDSEYEFKVTDINKEIKPGDYFKVKLSDNLSIGGLTPDEQVGGLDIISSAGVVAKGTYDKATHTITYRFTNYVENFVLNKASTSMAVYIDKKVVPNNQTVTLSRSLLEKGALKDTISGDFQVIYKGVARIKAENYQQVSINYHHSLAPTMGGLITKVDEKTHTYTAYVYYNANGDSISRPRLSLVDKGDTINPITSTTRVRIYRVNVKNMNPSFGYYEDAEGNPLTNLDGLAIGNKIYDGYPKTNSILLEGTSYGFGYVVKVDGEYSATPGKIKIDAYGEGVTYYRYRYNYIDTYVALQSNSSEAEGEVGLKFINEPNHITFTKTGLDDKPLAGATFELRQKDQNGQFVKVTGSERTSTITNGTDATFSYSKLAYGEYEIWETATSHPSYLLPTTAVATFKVDADGHIVDVTPQNLVIQNSVGSKLKIIKEDAGDEKVKLKEATFELYKLNAIDENQILSNDDFENLSTDEQKRYLYSYQKTTQWQTNDKGEVVIDGLTDGTYILKEVKAPKGYTCHKEWMGPIVIEYGKVVPSPTDATNDVFTIIYKEADSVKNIVTVRNKRPVYPSTGGIGTHLFMVMGSLMMLGAVTWYRKQSY